MINDADTRACMTWPLAIVLACGCAEHREPERPVSTSAAAEPTAADVPAPPLLPPRWPAAPPPARPLANLTMLWTAATGLVDAPPPPLSTLWVVGRSALPLPDELAEQLGLGDGRFETKTLPAELAGARMEVAGELLVLSTAEQHAVATRDGSLLWSEARIGYAPHSPYFVSPISPASPPLLIASRRGDDVERLTAWALSSGEIAWSWDVARSAKVPRVEALWTDGVRGYLLGDELIAFEPATGATLWTAALAGERCGAAASQGVVVLEDLSSHALLDAATGLAYAVELASKSKACGWQDSSAYGNTPPSIAAGRLFVYDSPYSEGEAFRIGPLRALDLHSGAQLWQASAGGAGLLVADQDAVYVGGGGTLIALDARTGHAESVITTSGFSELRVEPVGGDAGPLVVVRDAAGHQRLFGRAEQAATPESFVIRGRLKAARASQQAMLRGVYVVVGNEVLQTDARGRFEGRGVGRGEIVVMSAWELQTNDGTDWGVEANFAARRVVLDGSGTYELGSLRVAEVIPAYRD